MDPSSSSIAISGSPRTRSSHALALLALAWAGCGGGAATVTGPSPPPLTHDDPPAYAPGPSDSPTTGPIVGVSTAGGHEQAKEVAMHVLRAIRDADEPGLRRLLSGQVANLFPRLSQASRTRDSLLERLLTNHPRTGLGPDVPLEQIVETDRIEVVPLGRSGEEELPAGILPTDLRVTFPLMARGRQLRLLGLGWHRVGGLVVRPGGSPRVVAM